MFGETTTADSKIYNRLQEWLLRFGINVRFLERQFSDGILLAKILKCYHKDLVNVGFYSPANSIERKFNNWQALNFDVLRKLGLRQSKVMLLSYSRSEKGAIDPLLYTIMERYEGDQDESLIPKIIKVKEDDIKIVDVGVRAGNAVITVPTKMISLHCYNDLVNEWMSMVRYLKLATQTLDILLKAKADRGLVKTLAAELGEAKAIRHQAT